jgi:centrosomal protein CEP104
MTMGIGPQKLSFTVSGRSSEDPDFPACELNVQHADCQGWRSRRFEDATPHEVEIRLSAPARIVQLQLLGHEYIIPERIDIFRVYLPPGVTDENQAVEQRLGHVRMADGERSGFQTREMKTVQFDGVHAIALRFELSHCHVNEHNIYNQVALMAVQVVGAHSSGLLGCSPSSSVQPGLHAISKARMAILPSFDICMPVF